ncbi:hydantoinase B/oxoprolinase family protein [Desulforhopalus singaporensis]|uniref:N-methylhydantoinase B n=1 Tax=Desulforhopalus singaporensis TaxID=91360 RepID=A0A1H0VV18_9BACT|nr:hydantoinase B/oxoprolinase family protein [Desulforhopalus singaporensis]SDP82290.1 N-methylhydantoinase B [Desulforhopalus singaporensis]
MKNEYKVSLDPVTFEVIRGGFKYIPRRMFESFQKMSFTTIIYEIADFSVSIYDKDVNLIGQNAGCPIHLGAMSFSTRECVNRFPDMSEGDAVVLNDPYAGGTHTPDITVVTPMYYEGKHAGYACARGHWIDVGGGGTGSQAWGTHIASEGFRIFPTKLMEKGKLNEYLVKLMQNQVRMPDRVEGDFMAQIGCCRIAEREMKGLIDRLGFDTVVNKGAKEVVKYTESIFREKIRKMPDGVYEGIDYTESDGITGKTLEVKIKLTVKGDQIGIDFTGTSPLAEGAINSPLANTHGAVLYSLCGMLAPELPINEGLYKAFDIHVPEGCFLNAKWPYPTIGSTTHTATKIATAVWMALNKAVPPEKAIGSTYGECNWYIASINDPKTGAPNLISDLPSGGWGACSSHDGMNACNDPHIVSALLMSAEVAEQCHPVHWLQYEMRPDSGGPGKYRGGVGMVFKFKPKDDMLLSMETSRTKIGAPGTQGGGRGSVQYVLKESRSGSYKTIMGRELDSNIEDLSGWQMSLRSDVKFEKGSSFVLLTGGGGGYGNPLERDIALVQKDVIQGYVSLEGAKNDYGVVIEEQTLEVDEESTTILRKKLSEDSSFKEYIQGPRTDYISLEHLIKNRPDKVMA